VLTGLPAAVSLPGSGDHVPATAATNEVLAAFMVWLATLEIRHLRPWHRLFGRWRRFVEDLVCVGVLTRLAGQSGTRR
jgi:hypothetical protein